MSDRDEIERLVEEEGLPYNIARERVEAKTDGARIREFFEELDARIAGERGGHTEESKARLRQLRPPLVKRAHKDPSGFVRDIERQMAAFRKEDQDVHT